MKELADILNHNWIGTVIGIAGIVIGTILALSLRPRPRLAAQINTLDLVGPNAVLPTGIEFLFRGTKVPKVTLSRIAFWNIGNTTISGDQIVASDPLRIVVGDNGRILETSVLVRTREANDVACVPRPNGEGEAQCRFDYLDPGDGALIQIIHTGTNKLSVSGTLRGVPKGVLLVDVPQKGKPKETRELPPFFTKLFGLVMGFTGLVIIGFSLRSKQDWPGVVIGVLMMTAAGLLLFAIGRMPPSELSPQITSDKPRRKAPG